MTAPVEIRFTVPGTPKGKARPRFRVVTPKGRKGFVQTYTPKETQSEEGAVRTFAGAAMAGRPPMEGPLELQLCAYMPIPASWSKVKTAAALAGEIFPTSKPDVDNAAKLILDSCNEICFRDDSQIVTATMHKRYSDRPRVVVIIKQKIIQEKPI